MIEFLSGALTKLGWVAGTDGGPFQVVLLDGAGKGLLI